MKSVHISELIVRWKRRKPAPVDVVEAEVPSHILRQIVEQAVEFERPGAEANRPRVLIMVGSLQPWDAAQVDPAKALQSRFPELSPSQSEVAARVLKEALRARRMLRRRETSRDNWVTRGITGGTWS